MSVPLSKSERHAARLGFLIARLACVTSAIVASVSLVACSTPQDGKHATVVFERDGTRTSMFKLEVVSTPEDRARGLMFRKSLGSNEGMLFIFPREQQMAFWMKNTFIPLDMVFVSSDWRVVGVLKDVPPLTEERRMVEGASQYVLEFAGGSAAREGIEAGMRVRIEGALPAGS